MFDNPANIRPNEDLDWNALEKYLKARLTNSDGDMKVLQFHGGHANLSYALSFDDVHYVLRRPPFGKIAPGAHDMHREFKVLSRLNSFYPPAPRAFMFCEDESVIGAPFVIMERRFGTVVRYRIPDSFKEHSSIESRLTKALVHAQANLHLVDYKKAGLEKLGKSEAFLERQVKGWLKRWQLLNGGKEDLLAGVFKHLQKLIPESPATGIIHNDFKFDNCQFRDNDPDQVYSVFDWDMATIGDPLFDFASSLVYWPDPHLDDDELPVLLEGDFPDKDFLRKLYFEITGFDSSHLLWYECLAFAKTAVIASQLYSRFDAGESTDKRMLKFKAVTKAFSIRASVLAEQL